MKTVSKNAGFALTELLLIIIAVTGVVFTGYYVYHANKKSDLTNAANNRENQANSSKAVNDTATKTPTDDTSGWLNYVSPGKEFSIRLADGWKLQRYSTSPAIYAYGNDLLTFKMGVKATVTQVEGGKDGSGEGLTISFGTVDQENSNAGNKLTSFSTTAGDSVNVYNRAETEQPQAVGGLNKGGIYYNYFIKKTASKYVNVSYGFNVGQTDNHALVEKVIKTLIIN